MWLSPAGQLSAERALGVADELGSYSRQGVSARALARALHFSGYVYLNAGDRTRAEVVWHEASEFAQRTKDTDLLLHSLTTEIDEALLDGELDAAVLAATRVRDPGDELGAPVSGRLIANSRGFRPLLYLNRAKEALEALPEAGQWAGVATEQEGPAWTERSRKALVLAYLGRSDEARAAMNQLLVELRVASEEHVMTTFAGVALLETAVLLKDREAAALLASRLQPVAALAFGGLALTCVARHLGDAAALLGDRDAARAYYEQALELCGKIRFRPEIALTHLGIAELLLDGPHPNPLPEGEGESNGGAASGAAGSEAAELADHPAARPSAGAGGSPALPGSATRAEAMRHLDIAIAEFREMKMQPALERALRHKDVLKA